jgi:hypothetical protein
MDAIIAALAPVFAAGFAVQRLLEVLDPVLFPKESDEVKRANDGADAANDQKNGLAAGTSAAQRVANKAALKKRILGLISLILGIGLVLGTGIRVLHATGLAGITPFVTDPIDAMVTALVISAGTDGVNSMLKFLAYAKDNQNPDSGSSKLSALSKPN